MTSAERPATPPAAATVAGRSAVPGVAAVPVPDPRDDLRLPKPPGVFRLFFARHAWVADGAIVVVFGLPTILFLVLSIVGAATGRQTDATGQPLNVPALIAAAVGSVLVIVSLYRRRRHPLALVAVVGLYMLLVSPTNSGLDQIPPFVALYGAAVYVTVRAAWIGFATLSVVRIVAQLISMGGDIPSAAVSSLFAIFLMLIATLVGINVGNRKRYVEALLDRAAQLARERDQQALLSAASERARIAREMHDIIAHSLTVMVALADGADRTVAANPERAQEAIRQVAETGRVALADMRVVLGVLANPLEIESTAPVAGALETDGSAALTPQPGHDDLAALVSSYRAAGMVVVYRVSGAITSDTGIQLTVFRIVQEALTNSLRYAPDPKHVTVAVVYGEAEVAVTVTDDGQAQLAAPSIGTGNGIIGMRERVRGYGGTVEAGPTTAGGWQVRAVIPQKGAA